MGLPWEDDGGRPSFVRKEAVRMVTYGELFEFVMMLMAVATFVYEITKKH